MPRRSDVPRPLRSNEHEIVFATREAEKRWRDLCATARSAAVEAWEFLTRSPIEVGDRCHRLRGDLGRVTILGVPHERWQYKTTGGGRIWYAVVNVPSGGRRQATVMLERVTTGHPTETLKNHR